jgi:hypothetical protein
VKRRSSFSVAERKKERKKEKKEKKERGNIKGDDVVTLHTYVREFLELFGRCYNNL